MAFACRENCRDFKTVSSSTLVYRSTESVPFTRILEIPL
jgi:hypothetical protein